MLIVLVACGPSITPSPASAPTEEAVDPCATLAALAAANLRSVDERTRGVRDTEEWVALTEPLRSCIPDGHGAWMLFPRRPTFEWVRPFDGNIANLDTRRALPEFEVPCQPVHVDADGRLIVGRARSCVSSQATHSFKSSFEVLHVSDIDGDGRGELGIRFRSSGWEEGESNIVILTATDEGVELYPPADDIDIEELVDFDEDGRLDIVTGGVWTAVVCGLEPEPVGNPSILLHAQTDGSFSSTSDVAAQFLRRTCPQVPEALYDRDEYETLENIACVRAWGATAEEVEAQIRREWRPRNSHCMYDLEETIEWARIEPPLRLDR